MDAALPPDVDTVYVVHCGTYASKDGSEGGLANPVTCRLTQADADDVAQVLNDATDGVVMLRWAASVCFPKSVGNASDLMAAVDDADIQAQWEEVSGGRRKPMYSVTACKLSDKHQAAEK